VPEVAGAEAMLERMRAELDAESARQGGSATDREALRAIAKAVQDRLLREGLMKLCPFPEASFSMSVVPESIALYVNCHGKELRKDWKRS
jgi:hypothetical protein